MKHEVSFREEEEEEEDKLKQGRISFMISFSRVL